MIISVLAWAGAIGWPVLLCVVFVFRRRALGWPGAVAAGVISVGWGLGVWAFHIEPRMLVVRHVEIFSPTWRGEPVRIGVVSDLHVGGPHVPPARVRDVVARLNQESPDVVVLVGDYIGGHDPAGERSKAERKAIEDGLAALGGLSAPLGVHAVLGNHDWWYDGPGVEAQLAGLGVAVLENDALRIERPDGSFWIAGLADFDSLRAQPSYGQALSSVTDGEPVIALSHWPDAFASAPPGVALTIAAHSHCGQVNLPVFGRPIHASNGSRIWPCGLYDVDRKKLFVSGGVGTSILPVRFMQPPEVSILTLRAPGIAPPLQAR